jgi:copper(I)-binding protein
MRTMFRRALRCAVILVPVLAHAQQHDVKIEEAWSRPAIQGGTGVVYLTIIDTGAPDRLVALSAPVAAKADLHESFTEQGIAKMRGVATLPVAAGSKVTLSPGGYHIMLMDLKHPLREGDSFPVTLNFEHAGLVTATVTVRRVGRAAP